MIAAAAAAAAAVVVAAGRRQEKMTCRGNMLCHHGDFVSIETSHVLFL